MMANYHVLLAVSSSGGCIHEEIGTLIVMVILQWRLSIASREALSDDVFQCSFPHAMLCVYLPLLLKYCLLCPPVMIVSMRSVWMCFSSPAEWREGKHRGEPCH